MIKLHNKINLQRNVITFIYIIILGVTCKSNSDYIHKLRIKQKRKKKHKNSNIKQMW